MSTAPEVQPTPHALTEEAQRLTRQAWQWFAAAVAAFVVSIVLGYAFMAALDVPEGELLTSAGPWGWICALLLIALIATPFAMGLRAAVRARRAGGGGSAVAAMVLHAAGLAYVALTAVAQVVAGALGG